MYHARIAEQEGRSRDASGPVPPEAPLAMPMQTVDARRVAPAHETDGRWRLFLVILASAVFTGVTGSDMYFKLMSGGVTVLEAIAVILFCLSFAWISAAAATCAFGAYALLRNPTWKPGEKRLITSSRTAIIVPLYNEPAALVMGGVEAVWAGLKQAGADAAFDVFFLSDTQDLAIAAQERKVLDDILRRRPGEPIFYRRRSSNAHQKAGNVADFVQRWGGRYDYMLVLDADSLMSPEAICELVRRMDRRPLTALIQTLPLIVSAQSWSARQQQLALRTFGVLFAAGLSWWSGGSGNFWGHNAIIRVKAFARHARLPDLPGKAPLGGPILSHDFVEAALLRRAGWRVEIAPEISGSYEETPPTMVDLAARDRRWAQGNLQQIPLLSAKGFDWISRAHILAGVMGWVSAVLWLSLILFGVVLAVEDTFLPPAPAEEQVHGIRLLALTVAVVLSPKWLTLIVWAAGKLPGWKRDWRFPFKVAAETALSAVTAPIQMVSNTGAVIATLAGRDAGWRPPMRDRGQIDWPGLARFYRPHMILGVAVFVAAMSVSPAYALLLSPLTMCFVGAPMVAGFLSRAPMPGSLGWRLFATPEDQAPPRVVRTAMRCRGALNEEDATHMLGRRMRRRVRRAMKRAPATAR